jgi:hypothetical protein
VYVHVCPLARSGQCGSMHAVGVRHENSSFFPRLCQIYWMAVPVALARCLTAVDARGERAGRGHRRPRLLQTLVRLRASSLRCDVGGSGSGCNDAWGWSLWHRAVRDLINTRCAHEFSTASFPRFFREARARLLGRTCVAEGEGCSQECCIC